MNPSNRLYFLDNIRSSVILLVIILHGLMTYMAYAPQWGYVVDPQNSLVFTALVLLIDVPIMQVMFFISGYFAMPSLKKSGVKTFLKKKLFHVGLPWILGVLLFSPPIAYLIYYSRHVPMSLLQFWQTDFWGKMYQQSVYWYLGILMLFFAILALVYNANSRLQSSTPETVRPSWKVLAVFLVVTTASFFVINQFFYIDDWTTFYYLFVFQPLRLPLYVGYFILGIYAWQKNWLSDEGYLPRLRIWLTLFLLSGITYLGLRLSPVGGVPNPPLLIKAVIDILFNVFCLSSLMTALAFFKARVNNSSPVWNSLSASSYAMYYFHPLILYPLTYIFVSITLPLEIKSFTVILLGIILSWVFSSLGIKRLPLLREMF